MQGDQEQNQDRAKRQAYLEQLRRVLPPSQAWEDWLARTGELPPNFDALPSIPSLPDPLTMEVNGQTRQITNLSEWEARRSELKQLFHHWVLGSVPPAPDNLQAEILSERNENGTTVREVQLSFGAEHTGQLWLQVIIPEGEGPFPVFLSQHNHLSWALIAVSRGYIGCVYGGSDSRDNTDTFLDAFPGYDWSRITRRAWAASRCVDYLATLPQADMQHIAITGHSRNGKLSLIASALDERIALVISSSSGTGGTMTARYCAEQDFGESIEAITRVFPEWFHPRLRFFAGREDKLPVDLHELVALTAPRACLLSTAINDGVETTWAMQQTYLALKQVYHTLGVEDRLGLMWRPGGHETWATTIEKYLDWCDLQFGRTSYPFPEHLLHPYDWDAWQKQHGDVSLPSSTGGQSSSVNDWEQQREHVRGNIRWMLGDAPPTAPNSGGRYGIDPPHITLLLGHTTNNEEIAMRQIEFGNYISGDIYLPAGLAESGQRAPAVLWLHPFSYARGYAASYKRGGDIFRSLARQGYVVFCFDQIGFGRRVEEAEEFYTRYPRWSLLGKMVRDAQAALDILVNLPYVDPQQIHVLGYSLGSLAGLHLSALDERIAGLIAVCAPPPFRTDTPDKRDGGIDRWSKLHMLMPRLGFYTGNEAQVPYDIDQLLASHAPRPLALITPQLDRHAPIEDMRRAFEAAHAIYKLYGAGNLCEQIAPESYNQFGPEIQAPVFEILAKWKSRP